MKNDARKIAESVFNKDMVKDIWRYQYDKAFPVTIQDVEMSSILPSVFYMFRFGHRRSTGRFLDVFADKNGKATVQKIAEKLSETNEIVGFKGKVERAILGDLLLAFSVENKGYEGGQKKQVQRIVPAHYLSGWVDLPEAAAHTRRIPEMIVAILANQQDAFVEKTCEEVDFPVVYNLHKNALLNAFSNGMKPIDDESRISYKVDLFDESTRRIGVDQLLMVRLAQLLDEAPQRLKDKDAGKISNQQPVSEKAAKNFSEDLRNFTLGYANQMPTQAFSTMLEACISIGMYSNFMSTALILQKWYENGTITPLSDQQPAPLFVDCSSGMDKKLREVAEFSFDELGRTIDRLPVILTTLRLLDYYVYDEELMNDQCIKVQPYAREWIEMLGKILLQPSASEDAFFIHKLASKQSKKLAERLGDAFPEATGILCGSSSENNSIKRFSAALTNLMGPSTGKKAWSMMDSVMNCGRVNCLAHKRLTRKAVDITGSGRRDRIVRSLVLSDSVLEHIVHLFLFHQQKKYGALEMSYNEFLKKIRLRYGFHIDCAPNGSPIPNNELQKNRKILEKRLRDLGLLVGVNDAESMKKVISRFN